ncbi:UDP-N-acetylmuramate--L-alanine ligase [Patescibacteria group bacterium]|nr:MAG: UDP-N-acetylmuramate--L-alanine ligase [Patescibacteria group bacterium]
MELGSLKRVHCVGIGGIGMSAIAKYLKVKGVTVTGSDSAHSEITHELIALGIPVAVPYAQSGVPRMADLLIYSEAVPTENPDREAAKSRDVPERSGGEFLGILSAGMKTVAIAGTNGKSTTTAMVGLILEAAGVDPTIIVGSKVPSLPMGNVRVGASEWLVLEADEYRAKFLQYAPYLAAITNIEADHFDFYSGIDEITKAFQQFIEHVPESGIVILNADDPISRDDLQLTVPPVTYGFNGSASLVAEDIVVQAGRQRFKVRHTEGHGKVLGEITLRIPGCFNVMNALCATAVGLSLGVRFDVIADTLGRFPGIWRRFEYVGKVPQRVLPAREPDRPVVISDYGHHPTAITGTIAAAREFYPGRRIVLLFQPHQHTRTARLFDQFAAALRHPDVAVISDVYAVSGREEGETVSSADLAAAANREGAQALYGGDVDASAQTLRSHLRPGDVVIVMGAGNVDRVARELVRT